MASRRLIAALLVSFLAWAWASRAAAEVPALRVYPSGGVRVESAALLLSGQEGGEIPVNLLALPVPGEAGKARLLLRLRLDGPALLAGQTGSLLRVEICLYAVGAGGGIQGSRLETVEADLAGLRERVLGTGIEFLGALDLRPGPYSLRILVRNAETGKLTVRRLPLTIPETLETPELPPAGSAGPRLTARSERLGPLDPPPFPEDGPVVASRPAAVPVAAAPPPDIGPEGRRMRREVQAAYRAALAHLAAGRESEARAAVAAFEEPLLTRRERPVPVEALVEIEIDVARSLAGANPESLLPLLLFHQGLYNDAAAGGRLVLSTQARLVALGLLELYRQRGTPETAARFALSLGADLMRTGVRGTGIRIFQQGFAFDPNDSTALLYLAVEAERRGAAAEAVGFLERLLQTHPDHAEARLRLALAKARLGQNAEAEESLRGFIAGEPDAWLLSLAYQELARRQLAPRRSPEMAKSTLRAGLKRLPGDEKLTLLLASLDAVAAPALLAGLEPEGDSGSGAARHRYNLLPETLLNPLRASLAELAATHRASLAAALVGEP